MAGYLELEHDLENINLLTPETAQGYTLAKVHYLALQARKPDDVAPEGQQLELGRRCVACTRSKEVLWVWLQRLRHSEEEWTKKLQVRGEDGWEVLQLTFAGVAPAKLDMFAAAL